MYHNSNSYSIWALFFGLLLIVSNSAQAATVYASSAVVYDEGWVGSGRIVIYGPSGAGPSTTGYTSSLVPGLAASGYGDASYGALHASAFSGAMTMGGTTEVRGQGSAGWVEQLTFSSSTTTGPAFARAKFYLNGGLNSLSGITDVGAIANSTVNAVIKINGDNVFSTSGQLVSRNGVITTNDISRGQALNGVYQSDPASGLSGVFSFDIPIVFGTPFQIRADLTAFTQAFATVPGDVASAYSNFGSSGYWGGITEVHLANGTVLSDYTLSSQSGFDWSKSSVPAPVPVPAAMWLLGSGLLGLIGVTWRKAA